MKKLFAAAAILLSLIGSANAGVYDVARTDAALSLMMSLSKAYEACEAEITDKGLETIAFINRNGQFTEQATFAKEIAIATTIDAVGGRSKWCATVLDDYRRHGYFK